MNASPGIDILMLLDLKLPRCVHSDLVKPMNFDRLVSTISPVTPDWLKVHQPAPSECA